MLYVNVVGQNTINAYSWSYHQGNIISGHDFFFITISVAVCLLAGGV